MYKLFVIKSEANEQRVIFNDTVEGLEINTYKDSVEVEFSVNDIEFKIEYYKKDNVKMSIELV